MPKTEDIEFLSLVGAKKILIELGQRGPKRFGELCRIIQSRTPATIASRLRELEKLGLIKKRIENIPGKPLIIEYEITEAGKEVLKHLMEIDKIISNSKTLLEK